MPPCPHVSDSAAICIGLVTISRRGLFLAGYLGVLALATLTPLQFRIDPGDILHSLSRAFHPAYSASAAVDAVRNVALFAGWGALWVVTGPPRRIGRLLLGAVLTGAGLSIAVETIQLVMPTRNTSVLDVLTNTAGSGLGAAAIVVMVGAANALHRYKSYVGVSALTFAATYAMVATIEFLFPLLRSEPLQGVSGGPFTRLVAVLGSFELASLFAIPWLDIVLVFPLGVFAVAALGELRWAHGRAAWVVTFGGTLLAIVTEIGHGGLGLPIQLGAIIAHSTGIGAGAWAAARWLSGWSRGFRGRRRPLGLAIVYVFFLLLWAWRPFVPELDVSALRSQLSLSRLIPLQAHAWRMELFSVADIVGPFFLYLPVGALLAAWPVRMRGIWSGYWPGLYVAAGLETGQILVAGRYFDGTDLIVQCAAVLIGWAVMRMAGVEPHGEMVPRTGARKVIRTVNG